MCASVWGRCALPSVSVISSATPNTNSHWRGSLPHPDATSAPNNACRRGAPFSSAYVAVAGTRAPRAPRRRRRTRCSPSPRSAIRADGRNANARGRSCRGTGSAGPGAPHGIAKATANGLWSSECWAKPRGINRDLVGDRAERCQHARAAHHQAGVLVSSHHAQRGAFLHILNMPEGVAAALQRPVRRSRVQHGADGY